MRIILAIATAGALAVLASGCGSDSGAGEGTGQLESHDLSKIVASFYPLAFAAEQIGGDRVSVTNLTPAGVEPHDIELTAKDVSRIDDAGLVIYLGKGFQPAVEKAIQQAPDQDLDALGGIGVAVGDDPHVWLDPVLYSRIVARIGSVMNINLTTERLLNRLARLDRDYRAGLAHCQRHELVTTHAAFGWLAKRYGLEQVGITGIDPESEPGAKTLADIVDRVRRDHVTTIFVEPLVSTRLAETVARETGTTTAVLDPLEGLTDDEAARGENYFTIMRRNLAAIRTALGCR